MRTRFTRSMKMRWAVGGLLLTSVVPGVVAPAVAAANAGCTNSLAGSNFEIDPSANLKVDNTSGCIDWLAGGTGSGLRSGVVAKLDKPTGTGDDSFGQGTSEDSPVPTVVSGSIPPNKSDLKVFGVNTETTASGKFLELFWARVQNPSGTTNMDFELNQSSVLSSNGITPLRTTGDKLITDDLSKGGTVPTISIRTWSGSASVWGAATMISGTGGSALGSVNTSTITAADGGGIGPLDPYTFGEVASNFNAIFTSTGQCGSFGSAYLKSRSSDSFTAEIKDFIAPESVQITNCAGISTTLSASAASPGAQVHDSATISGATGNAGGTVTYSVYTNSTCTTSFASAGTKTVTNGVVPNSDDVTFPNAGTFYWQAAYSGDSNNSSATSLCTSETLVVNPNTTGIGTAQNLIPNDNATITGATNTAGGTIRFNLFAPSDATCAGTPALTQTGNVSGNGTYGTTNSTFVSSTEGTWRWQVSYSGDANNVATSSACGVENFTITDH